MMSFKLSVDNIEIVASDEYNFSLYHIREKKSFAGKKAEGRKKELIGYYGNLASALIKVLNMAILKEDRQISIQELIKAISTSEAHLKAKFGKVLPRDYVRGTTLTQEVQDEQQLKPHH